MAGEYVVNVIQYPWDDRIENYIYVGRPSKWGNPYTHRSEHRAGLALYFVASREEAIAKYEEWIRQQPHLLASLNELRGKALACYCSPLPCHADVLVKLLRETEPTP